MKSLELPPNLLWKLATAFAVLVALYGITRNGASIQDVCEHLQEQNDRNAATLQRSVDGLAMIAADPVEAKRAKVPGADYYSVRPEELAAALRRARGELAIYKTDVCEGRA